jgi:hypothetical protein
MEITNSKVVVSVSWPPGGLQHRMITTKRTTTKVVDEFVKPPAGLFHKEEDKSKNQKVKSL